MACPHPLDPLCIAVMLRLSSGTATKDEIARDLDVDPDIIDQRLKRLRMLGTIDGGTPKNGYLLLPKAHQVILEISRSGLNQTVHLNTPRDEASMETRLRRLKQDPMFQTLPADEIDWLAHVSRYQRLTPGEVLFLEGDTCRGLYILDRGTVRLSKSSTSTSGIGREQTIRLLVPGDSFSVAPVFDDGPNPVTAEVLDDASVILVPKQDVQCLVKRSPEFAEVIIKIMAGRMRHMLAMIEDVSMRDVTGRVAKILLQAQHPTDGVGAGITTGRRLTQREIAEMAGTAREVVARALKKMERTGAVSIKRGNVQILDAELLESLT